MKAFTSIVFGTLLFLSNGAHAYWKGFNVGAEKPTGGRKTQADWEQDFRTLQSLPGHFTSARLYASSDSDTLANAIPAALATGTTLLVGVWTENDDHFNAEKQALMTAIQQHGHDWIIAVTVGSEDLYRGNTNADKLATQIKDVRGMLWSLGAGSVEVGHVDTWTAWVKPENTAVVEACDFLGTDGYPYFEAGAIESGFDLFWNSVNKVRTVANQVKPGTWVWVTETGWPVSGASIGAATPSVANAQAYWKAVACQAFRETHTFWYTLQDYTSSPSFGVVDAQNSALYDLSC